MNRPTDPPFVLVAGAASRDVTAADPRGWRLGGAVTYASLTLARLGLRVGVIAGVDDAASGAAELDAIEAAGGVVIRVPLASGPVFEIIEAPSGRVIRCLSASDPISVFSIPRAWLVAGTPAFLGPVAGELGADWTAVGGGEVALGWQGLLRTLRPGEPVARVSPAPHALLGVATIVGLSREDVAGDVDVARMTGLLRPGATLVRTDAERGGDIVEVTADGGALVASRYTAVRSDRILDPTGAGDVFLAAMLAARIDPTLGAEVAVAAAAASLVVEAPGVEGVPMRAAVLERMRRAASLASRLASEDSSRASGRPNQA
jgi:sugar/nucleoside kinase (ribokinase family)